MTQCNERGDNQTILDAKSKDNPIRTCPSCGHQIKCQDKQVLKFAKVFYFIFIIVISFFSFYFDKIFMCFMFFGLLYFNRLESTIYRGYPRE